MCGNFGLLSLGKSNRNEGASHHNDSFHKAERSNDALDASLTDSMHQVSKLGGGRFRDPNEDTAFEEMMSPLKILEAQTACTEIRGGQAGGYSTIEYQYAKVDNSNLDPLFGSTTAAIPDVTRVRMVARKRHPLAADLANLYLRHRMGKLPDPKNTITGKLPVPGSDDFRLFCDVLFVQSLATLALPPPPLIRSLSCIHTSGSNSMMKWYGCSTPVMDDLRSKKPTSASISATMETSTPWRPTLALWS